MDGTMRRPTKSASEGWLGSRSAAARALGICPFRLKVERDRRSIIGYILF